MGSVEEKLKAMQQAANEKAALAILEEEVELPEDVDEGRFAEIAKELTGIKAEPTQVVTLVDTLPDVDPDFEDEPDLEPEIEEFPGELTEELADDEEEDNDIPEESDEYQGTPLPTIPDVISSPSGQLRAMVISVTTLPFIPARHITQGEKPAIAGKYHVLVEVSQPLQLGREYQIIL